MSSHCLIKHTIAGTEFKQEKVKDENMKLINLISYIKRCHRLFFHAKLLIENEYIETYMNFRDNYITRKDKVTDAVKCKT